MKLILPEQITEAQYKAYLADWGTERIVPVASASAAGATPKCRLRSRCLAHAIGLQKALITCADDFARKK